MVFIAHISYITKSSGQWLAQYLKTPAKYGQHGKYRLPLRKRNIFIQNILNHHGPQIIFTSPEGTWKYNVKETDFLILTFHINPSLKLVCLRKDHDPVLFCHFPNTITFFFSLQQKPGLSAILIFTVVNFPCGARISWVPNQRAIREHIVVRKGEVLEDEVKQTQKRNPESRWVLLHLFCPLLPAHKPYICFHVCPSVYLGIRIQK